MAGSLAVDGAAANSVSFRTVDSDVLLVRNHGGLGNRVSSPCRTDRGNGRNGADTTVLSGLSNISALLHDAGAGLDVGVGVPGVGAPGGAGEQEGGARPHVDPDRAVAQAGDRAVEVRVELRAGRRVDDDVDRQRAVEPVVAEVDGPAEELPGVSGQRRGDHGRAEELGPEPVVVPGRVGPRDEQPLGGAAEYLGVRRRVLDGGQSLLGAG